MFHFKITPDDGDAYEVVATTRDVAKWERTTKGAALIQLETEYRATDLYAVAYWAAVRQGLYAGTLVDFTNGADMTLLDSDKGAAEVDPIQSAA